MIFLHLVASRIAIFVAGVIAAEVCRKAVSGAEEREQARQLARQEESMRKAQQVITRQHAEIGDLERRIAELEARDAELRHRIHEQEAQGNDRQDGLRLLCLESAACQAEHGRLIGLLARLRMANTPLREKEARHEA